MKQAKSPELVKEHHKILKGDGEDGKLTVFKKRERRDHQKKKENCPRSKKIRKILQDLPGNAIVVANRQHTNAKNAQPSKQLA